MDPPQKSLQRAITHSSIRGPATLGNVCAAVLQADKRKKWNISRLAWVTRCRRMTKMTRNAETNASGRMFCFGNWR
jgi:hypothetical protein